MRERGREGEGEGERESQRSSSIDVEPCNDPEPTDCYLRCGILLSLSLWFGRYDIITASTRDADYCVLYSRCIGGQLSVRDSTEADVNTCLV